MATAKPRQSHREQKPTGRKAASKPWFQRIRWEKVFVSFIVLYVIINLLGGCYSIFSLKQQEKQIALQLEQAKVEQTQLRMQVDYMHTDDAVEKLAREKLGLVKANEILVVRADDASKVTPAPSATTP